MEEELQGAIRRAQVRGSGLVVSGQNPGQSPRFTPLLPIRSCFRTGALMTCWKIRWSLMVKAKLLDLGVKRAGLLETRNP